MRHHNSRLRLILAVSTVLALLASPAVVTLGASDEDDPGIASAMRYRATHGSPHSEAHVRHTFANPEAYPDGMFGVPLSDEETAEVMRRIRALGRTEAAFEWANEQDSFGGAYQDQDAEGKVVFQFTDGLAQARDQLDALIPDDVDFAVVRVDFSMKELRATKYRVAESSFAQELGQRFISVGPAVRGNTHVLSGTSAAGTDPLPTGNLPASSVNALYHAADNGLVATAPGSVPMTGGSQAHLNMQPYLTLSFCIALQGIFPSPN